MNRLLISIYMTFLLALSLSAYGKPPQSGHPTKVHSSKASTPKIDFKIQGNAVGDSAEDVMKRVANTDAMRCLKGLKSIGVYECSVESTDIPILLTIWYQFYDGKFYGFRASFSSGAFSDVRQMIIGKHGLPHQEKMVPVQTKAGVKYTNHIAIWNTKTGNLTLQEYGESINYGRLELSNDAIKNLLRKQNEQNLQNEGKKYF